MMVVPGKRMHVDAHMSCLLKQNLLGVCSVQGCVLSIIN